MTQTSGITIRSATTDDESAIQLLLETSFGVRMEQAELAQDQLLFPTEDAIVAVDGAQVVGNVQSRPMTVIVPGGRAVEARGIAGVVVAPTHRRRGILRAMYTEQHRRIEESGLPLTVFTASEGGIYGRFGYGPTVRENSVVIDRRFVGFLPTTPDPGGVRVSSPADAADHLRAVYDRWRAVTPGAQDRPAASWATLFIDIQRGRRGGTGLFAFVHPDGYALYRHYQHESGRTVQVVELRAVTADAHAALWRALFGLDLVQRIEAVLSDNDPLPYLLTDPRTVRTVGRGDGLWLRLMDVARALAARTYQADLDVVLAVTDPFRDAGGTFALTVRDGHAECTPTTRTLDLTLGIDVLASMYLGAHPARAFAAANRLSPTDSPHLHALDAAFDSPVDACLGWPF